VAGALLLISLPTGVLAFVTLRCRQPVQEFLRDSPDPGRADGDVIVALEIHGDLLPVKVILLARPENLLDDFGVRRGR
jgi:hypothetical protein